MALVFASIDPPKILFAGFLCYALSGPVLALLRYRQRAHRRALGLDEPEDRHAEGSDRDDGND
jgi:CDP-diacylglycerol--serine O-phosphatidyltransferase